MCMHEVSKRATQKLRRGMLDLLRIMKKRIPVIVCIQYELNHGCKLCACVRVTLLHVGYII